MSLLVAILSFARLIRSLVVRTLRCKILVMIRLSNLYPYFKTNIILRRDILSYRIFQYVSRMYVRLQSSPFPDWFTTSNFFDIAIFSPLNYLNGLRRSLAARSARDRNWNCTPETRQDNNFSKLSGEWRETRLLRGIKRVVIRAAERNLFLRIRRKFFSISGWFDVNLRDNLNLTENNIPYNRNMIDKITINDNKENTYYDSPEYE